jgi:CAAX prenyl protease-like protein
MIFRDKSDTPQTDAVAQGEIAHNGPSLEDASKPSLAAESMDILPYVVPMFAYVALGGLESYLPQVDKQPSPFWYPIAYAMRVVIVGWLAWRFRETWKDLKPMPGIGCLVLAVLTGGLVIILWVGLDGHYPPLPFLNQPRSAFDPGRLSTASRWGFIVVRMLGLVVLVPLIEELFWRSFLIRWLIDQNFRRVPIGHVTPMTGFVTAALFALAHPEWLPAFLTGLLWAWLLWQTKSLSACVVSHAFANLALGTYVIATGDWKYW